MSCVQILLRTPQAIDVVGLYDRCPPRKVPTSQREYITISQLSRSPTLEGYCQDFAPLIQNHRRMNGAKS